MRLSVPDAVAILAVLSFTGCATLTSGRTDPVDEAYIWFNQTAVLEVKEAYTGNSELYVRFNLHPRDSGDFKTFFAKAEWGPGIQSPVDLGKNITIPLTIITQAQWEQRPGGLSLVKSLDEKLWHEFRFKLAHHIAPDEKDAGAAIRSDEDEMVLYYDEQEALQVKDIKDMPAHIVITEMLSQKDLAEKMISTMREIAAGDNIKARKLLLTVDNEDDYASPFIYADLDQGLALNLKLPTDDRLRYRSNLMKKGMKSADYLFVDSYVLGIWKRPVSSSLRLFSWAQAATRDTIKPPALTVFEQQPPAPLYRGPGMDLSAFEKKLDKEIGTNSSRGSMEFLIGGDTFFTDMIEAIIAAKETIDVRIFIFDNDDYAVSIADLLKRKAAEGVKVRVLLDGMGQVMGEGKLPDDLPAGFVPPASMERYLKKDSAVDVRVRPNTWFKADHTKTIIIDNEFFYTGGMNIGREYRYHWHDLMFKVRGDITGEIAREFEIAWAHAGPWGDLGYLRNFLVKDAPSARDDGYPVRALYTRLNDPQILKAQLMAVREAKSYIYLHNSYVSDDQIIYELIKARKRGVDVRVILPIKGNHNIMNANNIVTANTMFRSGVRVFFYPGMSHIKAAVYDGWLCTGSANFDKLSLIDNLELNLATSDGKAVEAILKDLFEEDFKKSTEMTQELDQGWKERMAEFLAEHL
jgi:cardiolipin synthase